MLRRIPSSGWIEPSFDDFNRPTEQKVPAKKSNSTSLSTTAGKRKFTNRDNGSSNKDTFSSTIPGSSTSFKRPKKLPRNQPRIPEDRCLLEKYAPKVIGELALHCRKLDELRNWLERFSTRNRGGSFLLLIGPSGCGKTTAIRLLSRDRGFVSCEWTNPVYWREFKDYGSHGDQRSGQSEIIRTSQKDEFASFLLRSSCAVTLKGNGIICDDSNTEATKQSIIHNLIIVKELPNELYEKPKELENILNVYRQKTARIGHCAVVFIVSTNNSGKVGNGLNWQRLFSKTLLQELQFDVLEFNPVANTFMVKALRRIVDGERLKVDKSQLERLAETANGDLRLAINELQLLHSGERASAGAAPTISGRDTALLLFRALGRCIYGKRNRESIDLSSEDLLPNHLKERYCRPYRLDFDPESSVEQTGFLPSTFALFLAENVLDFVNVPANEGNLDNVAVLADMLEVFSEVDVIANPFNIEFRDKMAVYEMSLPARAVAFYMCDIEGNKKTYKSMRRPKWLDTRRKIEKFKSKPVLPAIHSIHKSLSISEYVPFDQTAAAASSGKRFTAAGPSQTTGAFNNDDWVEEESSDTGQETGPVLGNAERSALFRFDASKEEDVPIEEFDD